MANGPVILRRHDVPLTCLPPDADGFRIAHVTDLHFRRFGKLEEETQRLLLASECDLLVCTGDIGHVANEYREVAELCRRFFGPLADHCPCYAVLGNHDHGKLAEQPGVPLEFLNDRHVTLEVGGASLVVAGVNQALGGAGDVDAALRGVPQEGPAVLLAHYPSTVRRVRDDRVRLVLAGHTHGGQIRFPLLGCVWAHDGIPVRMAKGLHEVNGVPLHVSAGVGVSSFLRFRVLCPPEVSVLTLRSAGGEVARGARGDRSADAGVAACGV